MASSSGYTEEWVTLAGMLNMASHRQAYAMAGGLTEFDGGLLTLPTRPCPGVKAIIVLFHLAFVLRHGGWLKTREGDGPTRAVTMLRKNSATLGARKAAFFSFLMTPEGPLVAYPRPITSFKWTHGTVYILSDSMKTKIWSMNFLPTINQ